MIITDGFLLKILKSVSFSKEGPVKMSIIVRQPYAFFETDLKRVFKVQEDVKVKLDSRYEERRIQKESFSHERRLVERRRKKETLLEVTISN